MRNVLFVLGLLAATSSLAVQWECLSDYDCDFSQPCINHHCGYPEESAELPATTSPEPQTPAHHYDCISDYDCPPGHGCMEGICYGNWPC